MAVHSIDRHPTRVRPGWYATRVQLVLTAWADARHSLDRPQLDRRYVVPGRFKIRTSAGQYCTLQVMDGDAPTTIRDDR